MNDERDDAGLHPLLHGEGEAQGEEEDRRHDIDQVLEEEHRGVHGLVALERVPPEGEAAALHLGDRQALLRVHLRIVGIELVLVLVLVSVGQSLVLVLELALVLVSQSVSQSVSRSFSQAVRRSADRSH